MAHKYAFRNKDPKEEEKLARVAGTDLDMSAKQAIEICNFIKNKRLDQARSLLEAVLKKQHAIPFTRFTEGAGHKKGMSAGKYPMTAAKHFLNLLNSAEANAQAKGLSTELRIIHACAQRAARPMRYGRKRRIAMKRAHVELVVKEEEGRSRDKAKKAKTKKPEQRPAEAKPKQEAKPQEQAKPKKQADAQPGQKKPDQKSESKPSSKSNQDDKTSKSKEQGAKK